MRRRLLFGKFDHIVIYRGGVPVTEMNINVGELIANFEVFGVYKSGRQVKIKNSDCVWDANGSGVTVGANTGVVTGVLGSDTPVVVTATYTKNSNVYTASVSITVHNYDYKYFINTNADSVIQCTATKGTFGYTLYRTSYDNGTFVSVENSSDTISTTLEVTGDATGTYSITAKKYVIEGLDNKHRSQNKTYVGTFLLDGSYEVETENFGEYGHNNVMTITHLADSSMGEDARTYEYGDLSISVDRNLLTFANDGGTATVTASTTQNEYVTSYWASDGEVMNVLTNILTDIASFVWSGDVSPFVLADENSKTVSVSVATTSSSSDIEKTLTVTATSTKDISKTASTVVSLVQSSKTIVGYEEISLKENSSSNPVVPAKGGLTSFSASYQQVARWSDGTTTLVDIPSTNVTYSQYRFNSLGTTPTTEETIVANGITVTVQGLNGEVAPSEFRYDAKQAINELVSTEYLTPVISYSGNNPLLIPASGGSATVNMTEVTISQKKVETYTSEETIEKDADVTSAIKSASTVTAVSLGTTSKEQTKVGDSVISASSNGKSATLNIPVEQMANINHDGSKGTTVTYSDWRLYFTKDVTSSNQNIYLDEKFGDDSYIEPSNANDTYNNALETYSAIARMGELKDIHVRAVRTKSTKHYFSSGEVCHIVNEPEYYGDVVKSGLTVTCNNGVTMGALSDADSQYVITSVFPNPGSNHSLSTKSWTITAMLEGKTATATVTQEEGIISWDAKTPSVVYTTADAYDGALSSHSTLDSSMSWYWNSETTRNSVTATANYELEGTVPAGVSINANTGVITWSANDGDSRNVSVKITLTASSGVAGDTPEVVSNVVIATQKSGLSIDYYTILGYEIKVEATPTAINAAGGTVSLVRSGSITYTTTYVSGATSGSNSMDIPARYIAVTESDDTYGTFSAVSWNGSDGSVSVESHKTNVRNSQTVVYTPSITEATLKSLFVEPVNSIGPATVTTASVTQSKNVKVGSVYGDVVITPSSKSIEFVAEGGTEDTEVSVSQTYYDYYTSYNDGDTVNGKTVTMNVDSSEFVYNEPIESGSYLDSFEASHVLSNDKHYLRVVADANDTTGSRSGYNATMTIDGAGNKSANIVISASQDAGNEEWKFFIVAGEDKTLSASGTTAVFTYELYKTTYISNVYKSCNLESGRTVTGNYSGDISGSGSSSSGTMSKSVVSNKHNLNTYTYNVTFSIPAGMQQENRNFDGHTPDYTQTITHLADEYDDTKTTVEYTDFSAWIGDSADSTSNVSTIVFSKAGETKTLYGFSEETKTTHYYWKSDSSEDTTKRVVETLYNESTWAWSQPSSYDWTLSNTSSRNASENVTASKVNTTNKITVSLKATSIHNASNTEIPQSEMVQEAGLSHLYFIVANDDYSIGCTLDNAMFEYTIIQNSYDGNGDYIDSEVYEGSDISVKATVSEDATGEYTIEGTNRSFSISLPNNKHSETERKYTATFAFVNSSIEDTEFIANVTLDYESYNADYDQTITHLTDSQTGTEIIEYVNHTITLTSTIDFVKEGETKTIGATPSVTKKSYKTWLSDNEKVSSTPYSEETITDASNWNWKWEIQYVDEFLIDSGFDVKNPTKVTVPVNDTAKIRENNLSVTATLKEDVSITEEVYCRLVQEIGHVLTSLELTIADADKVIDYNGHTNYTVTAHYADGELEDVTRSATLNGYTTSGGSVESDKYTSSRAEGRITGNNPGDIIPGESILNILADKTTLVVDEKTGLKVEKTTYSDTNTASSNCDIYFVASLDGKKSNEVQLTVNGQPATARTQQISYPSNVNWSVNKSDTGHIIGSGNSINFSADAFDIYTITVSDGTLQAQKVIYVNRKQNTVTVWRSAYNQFSVIAEYAVADNIDIYIEWINEGDTRHSTTSQILEGTRELNFSVSSTSIKTITAFSGEESDAKYTYVYVINNLDYEDLELLINSSTIAYNGETTYTVRVQNKEGNWFDITNICPIIAYKDEDHTEYSTVVESPDANVSGTIKGCNNGTVNSSYKALYVSPKEIGEIVNSTTGSINAYYAEYSSSINGTDNETVYYYTSYCGLTATEILTVNGQSSVESSIVSDNNPLTVDWSINPAPLNGGLSSNRGTDTSVYSESTGNYYVTASASGYEIKEVNDNVCRVRFDEEPSKQLTADNITMGLSESGTKRIIAKYNGTEVTGVTYTYDTDICTIDSNGYITAKKADTTQVTISKDGYDSGIMYITITDDRLEYKITFKMPTGYEKVSGGFTGTLELQDADDNVVMSDSINSDYGTISVKGFVGDRVYFKYCLDQASIIKNTATTVQYWAKFNDGEEFSHADEIKSGGSEQIVECLVDIAVTGERTYTFTMDYDSMQYSNYIPCIGHDTYEPTGFVVTVYSGSTVMKTDEVFYDGEHDSIQMDLVDGLNVIVTPYGCVEYYNGAEHYACAIIDSTTNFTTSSAGQTDYIIILSAGERLL